MSPPVDDDDDDARGDEDELAHEIDVEDDGDGGPCQSTLWYHTKSPR